MALVEASPKVSSGSGPLGSMLGKMTGFLAGQGVSNTSETLRPIQALMQLGQNTQIGVGNIVGGNWNQPRPVTMQPVDLAALFGLGD